MIVWRTIPDYPKYEASSTGHIRRKQDFNNPKKPGRILSELPGRKGYLRACVDNDTQSIAPLICAAFHGRKPTSKHQAAHRNGINTDNRPSNLSWLTQSENYQDQVRHGTHFKGERAPHATLTDAQVLRIRNMLKTQTQLDVSNKLDIPPYTINKIAKRRTWSHI